jgi:hypothetical protein
MAATNNRRWLVIGFLVTFGLVLAAVWPRGGLEDGGDSDGSDSDTSAAGETEALPSALPAEQVDAGAKGRRIAPGCKPAEESLKYEELVGKRALVILSWHDMPARTAKLEIPVQVVGIEDGAIGVRFLEFPMREQYLNVWLGTEHIKPGPDGVFFVDPCSATVAEWPAMERGGAE